jgi:heptosyltransferase III
MPAAPRILVIRRRYLGDIVLLGSVLHNLRRHWPEARITLLAEPAYAPIALLHPDVNQIRVFPKRLGAWPGFLRALRRDSFTHVFDFDNTDKTALVARFTGAAFRTTFDRELIPFRHRWVYTHSAKVTNAFYDSHHITDTYLQLLVSAGVPVSERGIKLQPRAADREAVARFTHGTGRKILLHPGSRSRYRIWPAERFAAVCDRVQDELDAQVFIIAGPGERKVAHAILEHTRSHVVVIDQQFTLGHFAAFLQSFDLLLCHDSGPMHIAAGVGTPVIALFGSQNATIWHPVGEHHTTLQTDLPCTCLPATPTPCVKEDSYRNYCVRKISVDEVCTAIRKNLRSETQ